MNAKRFITFEGPEGAGKTTQITLLAKWLREQGYTVVLTHEPGSTPLGKEVRSWVLGKGKSMSPQAEFLLYSADRAEHLRTVIRPALAQGAIVLSDRFVDSSYAYQGYGRGLSMTWLREVSRGVLRGLHPDLTVLLDLEPQIGLARLTRHDRLESEDLSFHQRLRRGYLELAAQELERFLVLDARQDSGSIAAQLRRALSGPGGIDG